MWEIDEHGSGLWVALEHRSGQLVALEHESEAEKELALAHCRAVVGGECPLQNFQSTLLPLLEVSGGGSWSAT